MTPPLAQLLDSEQDDLFDIHSSAAGPVGSLPLTDEMLRDRPSGDIFGMTQNAGMGWTPEQLTRPQYLLLSTQGGIRAEDGQPIALGYHTGHWEVGLLMQAAAREFDRLESIPFAAFVSDPCDGRSQGTTAMMDSLAYRNDAAVVLNRLIRSLPTRRGVLGVATCDKGLPAMMIALASHKTLPTIIVPGTQFRNAPTDRMATYTNIRGQVPLTVKAGTVAFTHYDLWHGTAANRSVHKRHMIKFLFRRTRENTAPTWNHEPEATNKPNDWNKKAQAEDANNILNFTNPIGVSQSDHYKERAIRRENWDFLMGKQA